MVRYRTLRRPPAGKPSSPYRVKLDEHKDSGPLILHIFDEAQPGHLLRTFRFEAAVIKGEDSIYFRATETGGTWDIKFYGALSPSS